MQCLVRPQSVAPYVSRPMPSSANRCSPEEVTCEGLMAALLEDLASASQAVISGVVHAQTRRGAQDLNVAAELEPQPAQEQSQPPLRVGPIDDPGGNRWGLPGPSCCHPILVRCRGSISTPRSSRAGTAGCVFAHPRLRRVGTLGAVPRFLFQEQDPECPWPSHRGRERPIRRSP